MVVIKKENETLEEALDRATKERKQMEAERKKPKELTDKIGCLFDMAIIFNGSEVVEIYLDDEKEYTFGELLSKIGRGCVSYIMLESPLKGEIWQYGNYGDNRMYYHGTTIGYA